MQGAIFHQSRKHKDEANRYKEIHCRDIGDLGQRFPGYGAESSHGQDSSDTYKEAQERRWHDVISKGTIWAAILKISLIFNSPSKGGVTAKLELIHFIQNTVNLLGVNYSG